MEIPFGPFNPDVAGPGSLRAQVAEGVIPQASPNGIGYGPFPMMVSPDGAGALSDTPRGIRSVQLPDGSWKVIAATGTTIEEMDSTYAWTDIDTGRTVPDGDDVSFSLIGTTLVNTDTSSGAKAYDIQAGGANTAISGAIAGRATFVMRNVVFLLGTSAAPRRFASSDIGNHTRWSGGAAVNGTLEDGGGLVGGADLRNGTGLMFQESAIRIITFGAGVSTYRIDKLADGLGCVAERTIATFDGKVAWWAEDGLWMVTSGSAPVPIGAEKINRWTEANVGRENYPDLQAAVDPLRKLFLWRLDSSRVLAFSWLLGEFSIIPANTTALARIATPAVSIDSLSGTIDELAGTIDSLGGSSAPVLGGLNLSRKFFSFSGANMAATLETCVVSNPVSGLVGWATPVDDCSEGTLQLGVSDRLDTDLTWKTATSKVSAGRVPLRGRGLNVAFRRNIPAGADWTFANGVKDIRSSSQGPK